MDSSPPTNPYHPDDPALAAFAGREAAFARLHQHLTNPTHAEAVLFLGRRQVGKTALLRHFGDFFDETFIDVYLPLGEAPLASESDWLLYLVRGVGRALAMRDFTLTRLPEPPDDTNQLRQWFSEHYLHALFGVIRYRRLVLLLDDADKLIQAVSSDNLAVDHFAYLQKLLEQYPQLGIAMMMDAEHENSLDMLFPLVNAGETLRLTHLSPADSQQLLTKPAAGLYAVPEDSALALYKATGGQSLLLQRVGYHLFEQRISQPLLPTSSAYMERGRQDLTLEVKSVINKVYGESEAEFRETWQETTRDERLVLTAMVSVLYDDPLSSIDTARIESWLVETDYPLDTTAINAALRSLEYREIVSSTPSGLAITAGLMQTWLLEHARLSDTPADVPQPPALISDWRWLVVVILVVIGLLLVIGLASGGQPGARDADALPTVTLVGGD